MRILHVTEGLHPDLGGPVRSVVTLAERQVAAGDSVTIAGFGREGAQEVAVPSRVAVLRLQPLIRQLGVASNVRELAEAVPRFDVIHLHGLWLLHCRLAARVALKAGRPYIVSPRGMLYRSALTVSRWRKRLALVLYQRSVLLGAAAIHCSTNDEVATVRCLGVTTPCAVLPNPIAGPPPQGVPVIVRGPALEGRRLALFLGRLHRTKGLDLLLRAWGQVPAETRRPWAVVIAGPDAGGYGVALRRLAASLGLTDEVRFLGPLSDEAKWGWLATSELLVAPFRGENFGNVVPEALLSGVPVMASREIPWHLLVEAGAGWWLPLDEGDWTRGLSEALAMNRESLRAMGTRGADKIRPLVSPEIVAAGVRSLYDWAAGVALQPAFVR